MRSTLAGALGKPELCTLMPRDLAREVLTSTHECVACAACCSRCLSCRRSCLRTWFASTCWLRPPLVGGRRLSLTIADAAGHCADAIPNNLHVTFASASWAATICRCTGCKLGCNDTAILAYQSALSFPNLRSLSCKGSPSLAQVCAGTFTMPLMRAGPAGMECAIL